jgi:hypothetical protein
MTAKMCNAKVFLFASSVLATAGGVSALAALGAIAKVPAGEYWTVVLGAVAVGGAWLGLITVLHLTSAKE